MVRLLRQCVDVTLKEGFTGLRDRITFRDGNQPPAPKPPAVAALMLDEIAVDTAKLPKDVAVHAHIFYLDMAPELRDYLEHIPVDFHFYVTTDSAEKVKRIEEVFSGQKNIGTLDIRVVENRGRDIAPMLVTLGEVLVRHEIVLHLHTKRSPHNSALRGWRRYLLESLLGNSQRIAGILQQFEQTPALGILFPMIFKPVRPYVHIGGNYQNMVNLLRRGGKAVSKIEDVKPDFFPAGSMFWFRGKAIEPFVKMRLTLHDFEPEHGQDDATLAHGIERMFAYFAADVGLQSLDYSTRQFDPDSGASNFKWFRNYLDQGVIQRSVVLFDHGIGGGANIYSQNLINNITTNETEVLRCFYRSNYWFVDWIKEGDGMLFSTVNISELFEALAKIYGKEIIVNSLYGYHNIEQVSQQIIGLANVLSVSLNYKLHDFHALCPSPHLLNAKDEYCGVPLDHTICNNCLKNNSNWYIKDSWAADIDEWRRPFSELFRKAETINFFDSSSIEIFCRAFQIEDSKVYVTPHEDEYFECPRKIDLSGPLHVGVLGTLTIVKGGNVVNALSRYLVQKSVRIPITIVGRSFLPVARGIRVHGPYDVKELPDIVFGNRINVILMPSIVPETFSYTISEAMKMGLPIVAFDLGAQGKRVKQYELGKVVPLGSSPEVILAAIQSVLKVAQKLGK